jgi:hypothetical protein
MRWLLALHGGTPLPFAYGPLLAGATTRVLRNADTPERRVASAEEYEQLLARWAQGSDQGVAHARVGSKGCHDAARDAAHWGCAGMANQGRHHKSLIGLESLPSRLLPG